MKKIIFILLSAWAFFAHALPTSPSVTFGSADPTSLSNTQFNQYDGSVYVKTSDGTSNGVVDSVWHYSIKNNKWVKVPKGIASNAVDSVFGRTGVVTAQNGDYAWGQISSKPNFATVATSGDYFDLINKPSIPTQYTDSLARAAISLTTVGSGAATYSNSTGVLNIPTPIIPEQYNLSNGVGISITGTYPNQTISNTSLNTDAQTLTSSVNTMTISGGNSAPLINSNSITLSGQSITSSINGVSANLTLPIITKKVLSSNVSSTATARANIADWSFPVTAGKSYRIEIHSLYKSAATTTGGSIGFILPTGAGSIFGYVEGDIANTTVATTLRQPIYAINATNTTAGSFITTTGVSVINSPHSIYSALTFNCTTSGTFQVQWGSEVAASAVQLNVGSTLYLTEF